MRLATLHELAEHGVEGLSVERVARAAALNKTSVYRRWPTKDALIAAALEGVLEDLSQQLADTGSLAGDLRGVMAAVVGFVEQPAGRALLRASMSLGAAPAVAAMARTRLDGSAAGAAGAMVARAIGRGEWRQDSAPEPVFTMLVGAVIHRVALERAPLDVAWQEAVVDVLLRGVRRAPGR